MEKTAKKLIREGLIKMQVQTDRIFNSLRIMESVLEDDEASDNEKINIIKEYVVNCQDAIKELSEF